MSVACATATSLYGTSCSMPSEISISRGDRSLVLSTECGRAIATRGVCLQRFLPIAPLGATRRWAGRPASVLSDGRTHLSLQVIDAAIDLPLLSGPVI